MRTTVELKLWRPNRLVAQVAAAPKKKEKTGTRTNYSSALSRSHPVIRDTLGLACIANYASGAITGFTLEKRCVSLFFLIAQEENEHGEVDLGHHRRFDCDDAHGLRRSRFVLTIPSGWWVFARNHFPRSRT